MAETDLISKDLWDQCFNHVSYEEFSQRPKQRQRTFLNLPWNRERIKKVSLTPVETH